MRFVTLAALALWLGGIVFLGAIAAPAIFKVARGHGVGELGPQMVGAMLMRFNPLTYGLGVLLLVGWGSEYWLRTTGCHWRHRLWRMQGVCSIAMLALALCLGLVLMPRLNTLQSQVPVQRESVSRMEQRSRSSPSGDAMTSEFDRAHQDYTRLTMLLFWLGTAALLSLALRTAVPRSPGGS